VLTIEHRREAICRAYIQAVAAQVGLSCSVRDFDYGIDLTLHQVAIRTNPASGAKRYVETGVRLDIQAKTTTRAVIGEETVKYDLEIDNYNDLRDPLAQTPRVLALLVLPESGDEYLDQSPEALCIRGCCYWVSLRGQPSTVNQTKKRVQLPRRQVFSASSVRDLMERIERGDDL
jgi:hypothetical protein